MIREPENLEQASILMEELAGVGNTKPEVLVAINVIAEKEGGYGKAREWFLRRGLPIDCNDRCDWWNKHLGIYFLLPTNNQDRLRLQPNAYD